MSSPQMMRMFGFLPFFCALALTARLWLASATSWPLSGVSQQPGPSAAAARARGGAPWARKVSPSRQDADSQPPTAPSSSAAGTARFDIRDMTSLLCGQDFQPGARGTHARGKAGFPDDLRQEANLTTFQ